MEIRSRRPEYRESARWLAHAVGALRVPRITIEPIILRKKIEDAREVGVSAGQRYTADGRGEAEAIDGQIEATNASITGSNGFPAIEPTCGWNSVARKNG